MISIVYRQGHNTGLAHGKHECSDVFEYSTMRFPMTAILQATDWPKNKL